MDDIDLGATIKGFSAGQKVFGRYTLKNILGRGGMGVVWLARDEELERSVALKFLPEVVAMDKEAVLDLKRETRRSLDLTHSHIVRIYDFIQDPRTAAISMEYIAGDTLAARKVDQPGRCFEVTELQKWAGQLCDALAYAHTRGEIVHRDLKPANLMIDARGDLKVADFGIAASVSDSVSRVSAQAGSSGTPVYMSPQQMLGEKPAVTDDIYALGATLYELLTGKPPFYSGNVALQVQGKVPPSAAQRREELGAAGAPIPPDWESTIAACLAKAPEDRPQSAAEVAGRLGLGISTFAAHASASAKPFRPADLDSGLTLKADRAATSPGLASGKSQAGAIEPAKTRPKASRYVVIAVAVLLLAAAGYYFGIQIPAQQRAAAAEAKVADEQRLAAQRKAEQQAQAEKAAQAAAEDKRRVAATEDTAYQDIERTILGLAEAAPRTEFETARKLVETYLTAAPQRYKAGVAADWDKKARAWLAFEAAHRPGTLVVETDPPGATVILYPANIRKSSPAVFKDINPGEDSIRVEKEGYEAQDVSLVIKPGEETKANLVRLISLTGSAVITSDPAGAKVSLDGNSRHFEGVTPFRQEQIPPGTYRVTFQRSNWRPVEKSLVVKRNEAASLAADLHGVELEFRSDPPGAQVSLNGSMVGTTPLQLTDQAPGEYNVVMNLAGFDPATKTLTAESRAEVSLALVRTVAKVSTLVIYRPSHAIGFLGRPNIKVSGQVRGEIGNGRYWATELPAGEYDITLSQFGTSDSTAHVEITPGKSTYLEVSIVMSGFSLHQVAEGTARRIIPALKVETSSPSHLDLPGGEGAKAPVR